MPRIPWVESMKLRRLSSFALVVVALVSVAQTSMNATAAPRATKVSRFLSDVAAVSATDVWAVGHTEVGAPIPRFRTFIRHWNGSRWKTVKSSPNVGPGDNELKSVVAISHSNVWAVGYSSSPTAGTPLSLIEHWNGTKWQVVTDAKPGGQHQLWGVDAVSASDVWGVGYSGGGGGPSTTLIEHWNGSAWARMTGPNPGTGSDQLLGVAAISHSNVWAVGSTSDGATESTLVEHWNGSAWARIASPGVGTDTNRLEGVVAVSPSDVWAAGFYWNGSANQTLLEHWDGASWKVMSSPNHGPDSNILEAIDATSSSDVWAAGSWYTPSFKSRTLTERWDGNAWTEVPSPNIGTGTNYLSGVDALTTSNAWAVGSRAAGGTWKPLAEHWNGTKWKAT
jgi:hypothetical protein